MAADCPHSRPSRHYWGYPVGPYIGGLGEAKFYLSESQKYDRLATYIAVVLIYFAQKPGLNHRAFCCPFLRLLGGSDRSEKGLVWAETAVVSR